MTIFDFKHLDQFGRPTIKRSSDNFHPVTMLPGKNGYIILFHNNIGINTVGNVRHNVKVYYNRNSKTITYENGTTIPFRQAKLSNGTPAKFWMYKEDL